jgi:hypothetical protein
MAGDLSGTTEARVMTDNIIDLRLLRLLKQARVVASWHRPDDLDGAIDCLMGVAEGDLSEAEIAESIAAVRKWVTP